MTQKRSRKTPILAAIWLNNCSKCPKRIESVSETSANMSNPRFLIIDDDPQMREALELWFGERNYAVQSADNIETALLTLRAERTIGVVLADFMMPQLNGLELLRLIKSSSDFPHIAIVVMSHNQNPEFKNRVLQLGAADYVSKADGAKLIVKKAIQTLEAKPIRQAPATEPAPDDLRTMAESLLNLLQMTTFTEGLPPAAKVALGSAQKLAERIQAVVAHMA
jgi:CheY-like chemotaxis protein